ncbi:NAD(P)-binding protein [Phanerochaete sordida]|uniref:NAD(P)-binding protein n=1 Tax=Phanerochaete sordida TaxID=48140 RepID=A0A9P3GGU4_9APHY|nr:NAD(P)-binding protein [Phanerochaete sordida]
MSTNTRRPAILIAGVGNGTGTGGWTAREFSKLGFKVGIIARNEDNLRNLANELKADGGEAAYFAVKAYDFDELVAAVAYLKGVFAQDEIRAALWNVTEGTRKPFLEMTRKDIQTMSDADVVAGFAFAQEVIRIFKTNEPNEHGKRGFLAFTSATGARRGAPNCTVSATGKFALRGLSQSLAKEFKTDDIHVSHAIVDAMILTERWRVAFGDEWYAEKAKDETHRVHPQSIARAYVYLLQQDRSAWTWELDLRPSHEQWTW